jgi:hypothetical protein
MLDGNAQRLLGLLVGRLPVTSPDHPERMIGYKQAHDLLGLKQVQADWGESLKAQGLESLAQWTKDELKPAITGIIVNSSTFSPGAGYFRLFDRSDDDWAWWREQVVAAKAFDWTPYLSFASTQTIEPPITPEAVDLYVPADRADMTISRIIRDTKMARRVKQLHHFECQICGLSLKLANGSCYAEAHHVKPLGQPHNGPDSPENIMCLCPNHHVMMDYGVLMLDLENTRKADGHQLATEFVTYHNEHIVNRV